MSNLFKSFLLSQAVLYLVVSFLTWNFLWVANLGVAGVDVRLGLFLIWCSLSAFITFAVYIFLEG